MGGHTKLGLHARHIAAFAVHGVHNGDVFVHQLRQVFVAAAHHHFKALPRCQVGQSANDVVGLYAGHIQHRPAHQPNHLMDGLYLGTQVIRHGGSVGFVLGVQGIAKGGALGVKHTGGKVGGHVFTQALQHIDHAAYSPSGRAGRVTWHRPQVGHGMKSSVQITRPVNQQQGVAPRV